MGDQPQAIEKLVRHLESGAQHSTLLGVTGSGKTFTMANVVQALDRPTLVLSHNKTLAAQLYSEFKQFFPDNAVEYFVSYFDYYQPEAYIPRSDTYIEKDSSTNEEIERLRLSATSSLLTRRDTLVVASVSCIYGLGSPEDYQEHDLHDREGPVPLARGLPGAAGGDAVRPQRLQLHARQVPRARRHGGALPRLHGGRRARGILRRRDRAHHAHRADDRRHDRRNWTTCRSSPRAITSRPPTRCAARSRPSAWSWTTASPCWKRRASCSRRSG